MTKSVYSDWGINGADTAVNLVGELVPADWLRLNGLLEDALALEPADRARWLRELSAPASDLAPLLEQLLGSASSVETHAFPRLPSALVAFDTRAEQNDKTAGDLIGPYRLIRELGRGGMATVWLADRVDGRLDRQVALKIPAAEWTDRGLAERIRRECAVLASLNHPNIAQLYDAGWSESGLPYMAMEVVDGNPIDKYCIDGALAVRPRVRLFLEVLRAVLYAHAHLVVHRDLKPTNVLVTEEGRVKLLDFGIAKVLTLDETAANDSELTRAGGRPITLAYAAPEQILGGPITTATDIYALGVMFFELLCDRRPFHDSQFSTAATDVSTRADPPLPSRMSHNAATARELRGDLDAIACKALQFDPQGRYETAAAFADDLERYLDGRTVRAQRDTPWYRARRFIARNRLAVGAAAAVLAAVVLGLAAALWQANRAQIQAQNATIIDNFVLSIIQQADPDASQQTKEADLVLLRTVDERVGKQLRDRPDLRFPLHLAIATAYRNRGEDKQAADVLRTALREAEGAHDIAKMDLLRAKVLLGAVTTNDNERARMLEPAIPLLRGMGRAGAPLLVDALLSRTPDDSLKDPSADQDLREALAVAKRSFGLNDERTLRAAEYLARMLGPGIQERNDEAAAVLGPVFEAVRSGGTIASSNPVFLRAQSKYGVILCAQGETVQGIALLEETARLAVSQHHDGQQLRSALLALAHGQQRAGELDASLATYVSIYALLASREPFGSRLRYFYAGDVSHNLMQARRPLEAEPFIEEAAAYLKTLSTQEKTEEQEVEFQIDFRRLGTYLRLGEYERARALGDLMLQRYRDEKSPYYEWVTNIFMGDIFLATGRPQQAEAAARSALDYALKSKGPIDNEPLHYGALSRIALARGDAVQALAITNAQRAPLSLADRSDPEVADFNLARGRAFLALGRASEARVPLQAAYTYWSRYASEGNSRELATYWYEQALLADHQAQAAQQLNAPTRAPLDYPPANLARLANARSRPTAERIAAVISKYPLRPEIAALIAQDAAAKTASWHSPQ